MKNSNGQIPRQQNPQEEAKERLAEATPIYIAPRLVAIEDHRRSLANYQNRVNDAHYLGMRLLGMPDEKISPPITTKDMGDLVITGDTYQTFPQAPAPVATTPSAAPAPATTPAPAATATATPPKKNSWLVPALAAAGIGLGALGTGFGIASLLDDDKPSVVVQPGQSGQPVIVNPNQPNPDRDWKASAYVTRPGNK